jgi:hypothetical protein
MSKTFEYDLGMYEEKPYSPLIQGDTQELDELIMQRTDAYMGTKEFATLESAVEDAIEAKNSKKDIRDCTNDLWTGAFEAGYKAGMLDLMAAMAFNKAGITAVKYLKVK